MIDSHNINLKKKENKSEKYPLVSICIPTYNNEDTLDKCLSSFRDQNYPELEIVIVDGYSKDNTVKIAKKYTNKIFYEEGKLGKARQKSIEKSNGKILGLFDSDIIIPHKNWLNNAVKYFSYYDNVSTVWPENTAPPNASGLTKLYFDHWKLIIDHRIRENKGFYGGGNSLFLRDCINEIGGLESNIHWGEDFDLAYKLKDKGYKVIYLRDPVYHDTMTSWDQFIGKQKNMAKTLNKHGSELMGLTWMDNFYEQYILGTKGFLRGLLRGEEYWSLYPKYIGIRTLIYGKSFLFGK